ncbi:MAG: alpha/beta hydrolase [Chloroflexi bacterium]|nr:alpha/beta hydrolase [Chloroflexota bacterium]
MVKASQELNLSDRLGEISVPTLVVTGDDDRIVPTKQSLQLAEDIPGAELAVMIDCGHLSHEECPAAFLEAALAFVAKRP